MCHRLTLLALLFAALLCPACCRFLSASPKPDIVVATDGSGDFKTIQDAIASIPVTNRERIIVLIKDGTYREKIRIDASFVTLRGQSRKGTRIEFSQSKDDFVAHPDELGRAVVNLNHADGFVLENLTVENTASTTLAHTFTISGTGDRIVVEDCDVLSHGGDTVSLGRREPGHFYHARCNFSGSVDVVCPSGWCYATDCNFYAHTRNASIWHHGRPGMKFVLRNCRFDGVKGFVLGRSSVDARFYFVDCKFSARMANQPIQRMIYRLNSGLASAEESYDLWTQRTYFYNCRRASGEFDWFANNLSSAPGLPKPEQITAAWTFDGQWNPEDAASTTIRQTRVMEGRIALVFSEPVTVKGKPRLKMCRGDAANYVSGSGGDTLLFETPADSGDEICSVDLNGGAIIACQASARLRPANISMPSAPKR